MIRSDGMRMNGKLSVLIKSLLVIGLALGLGLSLSGTAGCSEGTPCWKAQDCKGCPCGAKCACPACKCAAGKACDKHKARMGDEKSCGKQATEKKACSKQCPSEKK